MHIFPERIPAQPFTCCPGAENRQRWQAWDGRWFCMTCIQTGLRYALIKFDFERKKG
jgi:hypothetical protein